LRINYLLEDTALFGGVKVVLHHANLLRRTGHDVRVLSRGPRPDWYPLEADFLNVDGFNASTVPAAELHVATYWTTIEAAASLPSGQPVHYCQGFEASYTHNRDQHPQIIEAYRKPMPAFVVSLHLAKLLELRFQRPSRIVSPCLEPMWRPRFRLRPNRPARVLVMGPYEIDWKGVATALDAIEVVRRRGSAVHLVRLSQWPLGETEASRVEPDEFHCHLTPEQVARVVSGCDLLLAPSWEQEGFGLPVLEAMSSGVPVVASRISSFEWFAAEAAELVPHDDPAAFADAAQAILGDARRWRGMRRAGLRVAGRFSERLASKTLTEAIGWAASGRWEPSA